MMRFFDFTSAQLKIILALVVVLVILSFYQFIKGHSEIDSNSISFSVQIVESDHQYRTIFKIDPNLSPADSLELLPEIGPVIASRIIAFRDTARFEHPEDIIKIKGIGISKMQKILPYLEIEK